MLEGNVVKIKIFWATAGMDELHCITSNIQLVVCVHYIVSTSHPKMLLSGLPLLYDFLTCCRHFVSVAV